MTSPTELSGGPEREKRARRLSLRMVALAVLVGGSMLAAALGAMLYVSWTRHSEAHRKHGEAMMRIGHYREVQVAALNEGAAVAAYYALRTPRYPQLHRDARAQATDVLAMIRDMTATSRPQDLAAVDALIAQHEAVADTEEQVIRLLEAGDVQGAIALATGPADLDASSTAFTTNIEEGIASARKELAAAEHSDEVARIALLRVMLVVAGAWGLFLLCLGLATKGWLVNPLHRASLTTRAIAGGDLGTRVGEAGPAELARLGTDVNRMADALIRRSDELNAYLSKNLEARTAELEASEQRFRSLVQHASDLITVIEPTGTIIYQSPSIEQMLGYTPDEVVGRRLTRLAHRDDAGRLRAFISDAKKKGGRTGSVAARLRAADGTWRHVEIIGTDHRDDLAVRGLVLNVRDVSERHSLEEQLRFQAFHDPLTQLANRARFADRLEHALARRARRTTLVAVLFLDLDDFKSVNDGLGHAAGDELLVQVGRRLRGCMRPEDAVARIGGDEFAVLIEELTSGEQACAAAQRILTALALPVWIDGHEIVVRASVGIAISGAEDTDANALMRNADVAMYAAKARGKNGYELYRDEMFAAALDRLREFLLAREHRDQPAA